MGEFKFSKATQGKSFRIEVAYVAPPRVTLAPEAPDENPPAGALLVNEALMIETDVLGFPANTDVEFMIFEPYKLHEKPLHTDKGKTDEETRGVSIEWTYDHAAHKDSVDSTRFVCVARVGNMTSISEPFEVLERFQHTLQGKSGETLPHVEVVLRAAGRPDVPTESDGEGEIDVAVPPADYLIEVLGPKKG
jgi:hypothetical protein